MRRIALLGLAAAMAIGNFAFTTTDVGGDHVFFHCAGASPSNQAEVVIGTWSEDAPAGAMGSGSGGCFSLDGSVDGAEPGNPVYDVAFEGEYEGAIESLALHMFVGSTDAGHQSAGDGIDLEMTVVVDGTIVFQSNTDAGWFATQTVGEGPFFGTSLVEGTLDGLKVKAGKHTVQITITTPYVNTPTFFLYGASDADAGLTFNPADAAGPVNSWYAPAAA